MKLYHWTPQKNVASILKEGLRPNGLGIVYLMPTRTAFDRSDKGEVLLEVETGDLRLSAFDDCREDETLC